MTLSHRSPESEFAATTSTASSGSPPKTAMPMMSQSTIYKRHQARVLKNMEKRDDPRPAVVRVLSGLPGFRCVIPPYDPSMQLHPQKQKQHTIQTPSLEASHPTNLVETGNCNSAIPMFSGLDTSSDDTQLQQQPSHEASLSVQPLHVLFAAGVAGATAEALFGKPSVKVHNRNQSPFRMAKSKSAVMPWVQEEGSLSIFKVHNASTQAAGATQMAVGATPKSQLFAGAATASTLFGTKAFVSSVLEGTTAQDLDQQDITNPLESIISSAVAGAMVAGINVLQTPETRILRMPMPLTQKYTLARHMMGATIYFSSYEALKSLVSQDGNKKTSITAVAISGATAGALYQSVLLQGQSNNTTLMALSKTNAAAPRLAPTILRTAPAHALLFVAYEWVLGSL